MRFWSGRQWWMRRPRPEDDDEPRVLGSPPEEGERKRLVVTGRDELGFVAERTWVDEGAFADWDELRWRGDRRSP